MSPFPPKPGPAPHVQRAIAVAQARLAASPGASRPLAAHVSRAIAAPRSPAPASGAVQRSARPSEETGITYTTQTPSHTRWIWTDDWRPINYAGFMIPVLTTISTAGISVDTLIGGYTLVIGASRRAQDLKVLAKKLSKTYSPNHEKGCKKADSHVEHQFFPDLIVALQQEIATLTKQHLHLHAVVVEMKQWLLPCGGLKGCGVFLSGFEQELLGSIPNLPSSVYLRASSERISYSNTSSWNNTRVGFRGSSKPLLSHKLRKARPSSDNLC